MTKEIDAALIEVRSCMVCAPFLPHGPRPIVQLGVGPRLVIIGQAPGSRVHASGVPWQDDSGQRLRAWTGLDEATFYDPCRIALVPMGLCFPGVANGADLPPRPECAPLWHDRLLALLPARRLTLLVGNHAQGRYLAGRRLKTLTDTVRNFRDYLPDYIPLPHPSWRSVGWMKRNPWFVDDALPVIRTLVQAALSA